jgi:hypothetical protein
MLPGDRLKSSGGAGGSVKRTKVLTPFPVRTLTTMSVKGLEQVVSVLLTCPAEPVGRGAEALLAGSRDMPPQLAGVLVEEKTTPAWLAATAAASFLTVAITFLVWPGLMAMLPPDEIVNE